MDLPHGPCVLWCLCYLGADRNAQNLRKPRSLLGHQLVLPRWRNCSHTSLASTQSLPKTRMDPPCQHASPLGRHRDDATCNSSQLHQLDLSRVFIRLRHLPVPAWLVAAQQLRAIRCTRCWFSLHGGAVVSVSGIGECFFYLVGNQLGWLPLGYLPHTEGSCSGRLPSISLIRFIWFLNSLVT